MALYKDVESLEVIAYRGESEDFDRGVQYILEKLDALPTADVEEVRHGQWLPQIVSGVNAWGCSECKTLGSPHWKRCPICEAKMDGERKDT